jgi:hypothetical protein
VGGLIPPAPLPVNLASPQSRGLVAAWAGGSTLALSYPARGVLAERGSVSRASRVVRDGITLDHTGSSGGRFLDVGPSIAGYPFSISAWCVLDVTGRVSMGLFPSTLSGTSRGHYIGGDGGGFNIISTEANNWDVQFGPFQETATPRHLVGVWASATDRRLYIDGTLRASGTSSRAFASCDRWALGYYEADTSGIVAPLDGALWDARLYNVALTTAEVWSLYAPQTRWELYEPPVTRRLHVDFGGGATNYTLTAESAAATITGTTATTRWNRVVQAVTAAATVTGTTATALYNRVIAAVSAAWALTGQTASTFYQRVVSALSGAVDVTTTTATTLWHRVTGAQTASVDVTGTTATLTYSGDTGPTAEQRKKQFLLMGVMKALLLALWSDHV